MFADKDRCRERDGMEVRYWHFQPHPKGVKFCGGKIIVKVKVREMQKNEKSPYYAYYDNEEKKFNYVYPTEQLTRMCSPDYFHEHEKKGDGKVMNVFVEEIEEWKGD